MKISRTLVPTLSNRRAAFTEPLRRTFTKNLSLSRIEITMGSVLHQAATIRWALHTLRARHHFQFTRTAKFRVHSIRCCFHCEATGSGMLTCFSQVPSCRPRIHRWVAFNSPKRHRFSIRILTSVRQNGVECAKYLIFSIFPFRSPFGIKRKSITPHWSSTRFRNEWCDQGNGRFFRTNDSFIAFDSEEISTS